MTPTCESAASCEHRLLQRSVQFRARRPAIGAVVFGHGSGMATKTPAASLAWQTGSARAATPRCASTSAVSGNRRANTSPPSPRTVRRCSRISPTWRRAWSSCAAGRRSIGIASVLRARPGRMDRCRESNAAFMLVIVGPTVSYGLEIFYSSIVEVTNRAGRRGLQTIALVQRHSRLRSETGTRVDICSGLWLLGGEDRSIPTPATVAILDQLIASGKPYTHVVFPGVGHNLPPSWPDIDQWLAIRLECQRPARGQYAC